MLLAAIVKNVFTRLSLPLDKSRMIYDEVSGRRGDILQNFHVKKIFPSSCDIDHQQKVDNVHQVGCSTSGATRKVFPRISTWVRKGKM